MKLFSPIKRWWRSKGFGIHSPFAFYFILRVLREKLPFYAYSKILKLKSSEVSHSDLLTLFRIICYFAPTEVTLPEGTPKEVRKVVTLADSRISITTAPTNFQCYFSQNVGNQIHHTRHAIEGEGVIIFFRPTADTLRIKEDMTCGMTFINAPRSLFILVTRHDLPRQDFEINF